MKKRKYFAWPSFGKTEPEVKHKKRQPIPGNIRKQKWHDFEFVHKELDSGQKVLK